MLAPRLRFPVRLGFFTALVAVFWLALLPAPDIVQIVSWQDKVEHTLLFAALALLGLAGWPHGALALGIGLLAYGAAMEVAQSFTGYRVGDPLDWLADVIGVAILLPISLRNARQAA